MNHEPLTPFEQITRQLPPLTAWQASWDEAEDMLREACPDGFDVLQIGRTAWDCLPEGEQEAALDALFYCWWTALMSDREARSARTGGESA
jgi:hypothetical protein